MPLTPILGALSSWNTLNSYFIPTYACLLIANNVYERDSTVSYNNYKVMRLNIETEEQFEMFKTFYFDDEFSFWTPPSLSFPTDILLSPLQVEKTYKLLNFLRVSHEILIPNVQTLIDRERLNYLKQSVGMNFQSYQRLHTIYSWMDLMAEQNPEFVTIKIVGYSGEGRPLKIMKISSGSEPGKNKSAIWIDGGMHGREWISTATITYIANELIHEFTKLRSHSKIIAETFVWYITPVLNPDGYEYTFTNDRMWQKSRTGINRPKFGNTLGCCNGTDLYRNWDFNWSGKGSSQNLCSQIYRGSKPASEPEVYNIQNFIMERKERFKMFLTFQSYSQMIILPNKYDNTKTEDHDDLMRMAHIAADSLESVHGTQYKFRSSDESLYPIAGGSSDWAKGKAGIKFSYTFKLRDNGTFGFLLPSKYIIPTGKETFTAVKAMANEVSKFYNLKPQKGSNYDHLKNVFEHGKYKKYSNFLKFYLQSAVNSVN